MPMRKPRRPCRTSFRFALALATLLCALPPAMGAEEVQIAPPDDRILTTKVEATLKESLASIQVYCRTKSARLFIDRNDVGWVPYAGDLAPGSHYLEVQVPGYYPLGTWFTLDEKKLYTIDFDPARITGFLDLEAEPKDAAISLDGEPIAQGATELPIGPHRLVVRRFGYAEKDVDLRIAQNQRERISLSLEKLPFAIEGFGFSRKAFNPRNAGAAGKTSLDFRATSYGSARAEIIGPDGASVATLEYPDIEDWSQSRPWEGLGRDGEPLPDGVYTARLSAKPAEPAEAAEAAEPIAAEAQVIIDSTLVVRPFGSASALPGLLYMPDPIPASAGTIAVESFYFLPLKSSLSSSGDSAFGLAAALSLRGLVTLSLHASAETEAGPINSGDLAGSALVALFGDKTSAWSGAFFARGCYSSAEAAAMPGAGRAVEASLPLGARLGGIPGGDIRIALAPGARVDFSSSPPAFLGLGRAAFWLEGRSFRAGLSGELPLSFAGAGPSLLWPLKAALEGRLMLGSFVAAAYATAELSPDAAPGFGIGLGLGLLF
jgi:hypothetical protein